MSIGNMAVFGARALGIYFNDWPLGGQVVFASAILLPDKPKKISANEIYIV
jgi:hypothetical protein